MDADLRLAEMPRRVAAFEAPVHDLRKPARGVERRKHGRAKLWRDSQVPRCRIEMSSGESGGFVRETR